jgi:superfamily II DNA or RNA helicase
LNSASETSQFLQSPSVRNVKNLRSSFVAGDRVTVRRQPWSVLNVRLHEDCGVVTVRGIGPLNSGQRCAFITPFDLVEPLARAPRVRAVTLRRWRRRCRSLLAGERSPDTLATAVRAQIDLLPHQLEPALALLRGFGSRVLIADDVGLGKTVQAALIVSELCERGAADRALILTPAGLRDQWSSELRIRFGLDPVVVDAYEARRRGARLPIDVNPWTTFPLVIASTDFIKRAEVLPAVQSCRWDIIVVDEAHGVTPGSERYAAVNALSQAAPYVVLLTATPHNGDRAAFESLCRIGAVEGHSRSALLLFRRSRRDLRLVRNRRVHWLRIRPSSSELALHEHLSRFASAVRAEHGDRVLALATLHKRALSSPHSLLLSVERRLSSIGGDRSDLAFQLALPLDDGGGELDPSDDIPEWSVPALGDAVRERQLLEALAAIARSCRFESKLAAVVRLLARLARQNEPAIVFTEYRDTLLHLHKGLASHPGLAVRRIALLHGGLTRYERRLAIDQFEQGQCPLLLATDAGGEGLNLHRTCRLVVNLELPWNPVRLEQRIGRVDRIGQQRMVHAFNLIAEGVGETEILERLQERLVRASSDLDAVDPLGIDEDAEAKATPSASAAQDNSVPLYEPPDMTAAAATEHRRLTWVRQLDAVDKRNGSELVEAPDALLAFARRPSTRGRLAGILVVVESRWLDGAGRVVAVRVLGAVLRLARAVGRGDARTFGSELMRWLERSPPLSIADDVSAAHRGFWDARSSREHAIAESMLQPHRALFQPGLFQPRTSPDRDDRTAGEQEIRRRLDALAMSRELSEPQRRVALIMLP